MTVELEGDDNAGVGRMKGRSLPCILGLVDLVVTQLNTGRTDTTPLERRTTRGTLSPFLSYGLWLLSLSQLIFLSSEPTGVTSAVEWR